MKLLIYILFAYLSTFFAFSQTNNIPAPDWENIHIVSETIPDSLDKILIITNRPYIEKSEDGVLFPNKISEYRKLSYLEVAHHQKRWLIKIHENFESISQKLNKQEDILLFVHGHGKTLPSSIQRAMEVKKRYQISLILFDWPAQNSNFNKSLARVRRCSKNFHNTLLNLKDYRSNVMSNDQSLNILAHSLGNYFLTHLAVSGAWQHLKEPFVDNIIFNAPAVRSKEHGKAISLLNFSRNKFVILNKNDFVLKGANLLTFGKMLGNEVILPHASNTQYFHFTSIAGKEHTYFVGYHKFENNIPSVFKLYNSLIHGEIPKFSELNLEWIIDSEYMLLPISKKP